MTHDVTAGLKWSLAQARVEQVCKWHDSEGASGFTVKLAYFGGINNFQVDQETYSQFSNLIGSLVSVQGEFFLAKDRKLVCRSFRLVGCTGISHISL